MRSMILATIVALTFASGANAVTCRDKAGKFIKCPPPAAVVVVKKPDCKVGVACGNSCIAKGKICRKPA